MLLFVIKHSLRRGYMEVIIKKSTLAMMVREMILMIRLRLITKISYEFVKETTTNKITHTCKKKEFLVGLEATAPLNNYY